MTGTVALLRGVNVGGARRLAMTDLVAVATAVGLHDPVTVLQSGNLVVADDLNARPDLAARLEAGLRDRLDLSTQVIVRSASALRALIAHNPFPDQAAVNGSRLQVHFLSQTAADGAAEALQSRCAAPEAMVARASELFVWSPDGVSRSRLTATQVDRLTGAVSTARNWNTLLKIAAALPAPPPVR